MADLLAVPRPDSDRGFERFNIAPTDEVLVDGRRTSTDAAWSSCAGDLSPSWAQGGEASLSR